MQCLVIPTLGTSGETLQIEAFRLNGGKWHKLKVIASTPGSLNGTAEWEFHVNLSPYGGSCTVTPDTGTIYC